ncbi:hypothetical protein Dsin_006293 [Dipteronia sinensis]|uniref:RING-type domain-containing protein n=1 Tax=Dipteronia sinensis TaxID=43782 RepID=A0AAE0EFH6_9ROSI|nr:hypothetical protein Dsin_006293 [Dipteronia sinensis]
MENAPTIPREPLPFLAAPSILTEPPPFPEPPGTVDLSPLAFILALLAVITIPALIYAFFFAVKCPPWSSRRRSPRRSSDPEPIIAAVKPHEKETVSGLKYRKESHFKDIGSECPVCLSVFSDGEDIKQLSACKHSFHANCIDMWLNSQPNCPICRAAVGEKRPDNGASRPRRVDNDLHEGLPDAAGLV